MWCMRRQRRMESLPRGFMCTLHSPVITTPLEEALHTSDASLIPLLVPRGVNNLFWLFR